MVLMVVVVVTKREDNILWQLLHVHIPTTLLIPIPPPLTIAVAAPPPTNPPPNQPPPNQLTIVIPSFLSASNVVLLLPQTTS